MRWSLLWVGSLAVASVACSDSPAPTAEASEAERRERSPDVDPGDPEDRADGPNEHDPNEPASDRPTTAGCSTTIPIYAEGAHDGEVCVELLDTRGLTALDLSDAWVPFIFRDDPSLGEAGHQPYRAIYQALADERLQDVPDEYCSRAHWLMGVRAA